MTVVERAEIEILDPRGLHTRPCARLYYELDALDARTEINLTGLPEYAAVVFGNHRSYPGALFQLRARCGDIVRATSQGPDAKLAMLRIRAILSAPIPRRGGPSEGCG